jgi:S-DNA-T family DNA segregation ATPase FtsK/SpoIIIE
LYIDSNHKHPLRIQAPFVSTPETEVLVEAIKEKYMKWLDEKDIYHPEIINVLESKVEVAWSSWTLFEWDELLVEQAIQIISDTKKASATMLQRKLWIWFARAARIMDILEEKWIIGPQDGAKARDIYI